MFDTMTLTKIVGGVCSALLIFLLGSWVADALYSTGGGHGAGHGETEMTEGDHGAADDGHAAEPAAAEGPSFEEIFAAADVAAGEKIFKKCKACHKLDAGANATGPSLFGIVGRDVGIGADFKYSDAMLAFGGAWTPERLDEFLRKPKEAMPGTKMGFAGLKKPGQRADLIAYLATVGE